MKSNSKQVSELVQAHILSFYDDVKALRADVQAIALTDDSTYTAAHKLVEGGNFYCYFTDVQDFLKTLDINPKGLDYTDDKAWTLYMHLLARNIEKLV